LLTLEEKELLTRTAKLIEELLETVRVSDDKELVQDVQDALSEVKENKTRPLNDLVRELGLEDQVQT
jgi:hypothetical protein